MMPVQADVDYYAVLQIENTATPEVVTRSYRQLAIVYHPDKNLGDHGSTAAFQKLQNAYETIKDAEKRRLYDMKWPSIKEKLQAQQESEKRKAEAEEREQRRATQQKAKEKKVDEARQERVRHLDVLKRTCNDEIFEVDRAVRKLITDLTRLQDEDSREYRERNGWLAYLTSPFYVKQKETEDEKMAKEIERIQRLAIKRIKESELKEKESRLKRIQDALQDAKNKIAIENEKAEEAFQALIREEKLRKAKEASMEAERDMREKRARLEQIRVKAKKERAEREAKIAREAQEELARVRKAVEAERYKQEVKQAQRRQEEHERTRKASAEINQKLTEERKRARHAAEQGARNAQAQAPFMHGFSHDSNSTSSSCKHEQFWPRVMGSQQCQNCNLIQNRFAFQCPGCRMMACASCRLILKREVQKGG